MDEDFYDSDLSAEDSDEDARPAYSGAIQPYMFEPMMTPEEASANETALKTVESEIGGRRLAEVSKWYGD